YPWERRSTAVSCEQDRAALRAPGRQKSGSGASDPRDDRSVVGLPAENRREKDQPPPGGGRGGGERGFPGSGRRCGPPPAALASSKSGRPFPPPHIAWRRP